MVNQKVLDYLNKQSSEHRAILKKLREIIFKTLPDAKEDFAWGVPIYAGGKFYLASLKKQVNMGFSIIGLNKDEISSFEGSGKTARHIKVPTLDSIDEKQIIKLLKLVNKKSSCPK
ncbi:DUF1801 domain-containing protein [Candidatus Roizmanbacteria bacterium]|jgi:hypothetical protein|nr:DUF1801 domain-containing protein [Candidatus Roizmanbacteria bacterium]